MPVAKARGDANRIPQACARRYDVFRQWLGEAIMRRLVTLLCVLALGAATAETIEVANAAGKIRLAQTSTVTNCMMVCNSQAAACQTTCLVFGAAPIGAATATSNANVSTSCQLNCSTIQIACHTTCAQNSPSQ
jgi:hypothetical protein